jgi:hypothetical protein
MWQLVVDPSPPLKLELVGSQAISPAATTIGSPADESVGVIGAVDVFVDGKIVGIDVRVAVAVGVFVNVRGVGVAVCNPAIIGVNVGITATAGVLVGNAMVEVAVGTGPAVRVSVGGKSVEVEVGNDDVQLTMRVGGVVVLFDA